MNDLARVLRPSVEPTVRSRSFNERRGTLTRTTESDPPVGDSLEIDRYTPLVRGISKNNEKMGIPMNDATTLRIAAVFAFLSPLAIFAAIPFAAGLGGAGGPGPIDFGNGAVLARLAELGVAPARVDLFALLGPILALPATIGWYVLLRAQGRLALLGVVLWYFGMVFIIAQDAVQLALVSTLPASYAAADTAARVAIEVLGTGLARSIEVLAFSGHLPNGFGIILLSLLMWRCATIPRWLAGIGLVAGTIALGSAVLAFSFPAVPMLGIGVPIGIFLMLGWGIGLGVVMLREAKRQTVLA